MQAAFGRSVHSFAKPSASFRSFHTSRAAFLRLGDEAPNFTAKTTQGTINFHEWIGDSWAILFSHPKAFTPVCTTELGYMAKINAEFEKRGVKVLALSIDDVDADLQWSEDIAETQGYKPSYPIIADQDQAVATKYDMLKVDEEIVGLPATVRAVFVITPQKKIATQILYPPSTGRNFDEVLRVVDSLQLTTKEGLATPVNWQPGEKCMIPPSVSDEEAKQKFPQGWESPKPYLRLVQPK